MALHIETSGSGPDLVLLHGWGMNAAVWTGIAPVLAQQFRLHRVDLPGHGASAACEPYTLEALSALLAAALPPRVAVCGWSLGAQLALQWALAQPRQVERMVLIAGTPRFVLDADWECGIAAAVVESFAQELARDARGTVQRFLALQAQDDADARAVLRRLRGCVFARGEPDATALAAALRLLEETDLRAGLKRVAQPVLLLHGERDALVPRGAAEYLARVLPCARLEVFAGAGHAPFIAQPQRSAQHIAEFCGG